jgi:outer membrane protein assembly factor BamB
VAAGAFKGQVEIWDISTAARLSSFPTVLDFGGQRLCLDGPGARCFAGAYHRAGAVAYDAADGNVVWSRSDIKRVQHMSRSADGSLFIGVADGPCQVLDAVDGKTLEKLRGVRQVFESADGTARLLDKNIPIVELRGGRSFEVRRTTFAILDVAFGSSTLCLSEASGPTRCLDLEDGREVWRYQPPQGEHVLSIAYGPSAGAFLGVSLEYERTSSHTLVRLGSGNDFCRLATLGQPAVAEFCLSGEALLLDDGRLLTASTGELIRMVSFAEGVG